MRCPNCNNGITTVSIDHVNVYSVSNRGKITSIRFQYTNKASSSIKYKTYGKYISESRLASTEEEAIKICESLNTFDGIADGGR